MAIEDFDEALKLNPDYADAYFKRGVAKVEMSEPDYVEAIQDYNQVINLNPDNFSLAHAYARLGDVKKTLKQDVAAKGDYAKAHFYSGIANLNNDHYQAAIKDFDKSIDLNPSHAEAYYELGNAKQKNGDYEEAKQDYQKVINRKPNYAEAYYSLGVVYSHLNNYKVALGHFDEVISKKPKFAEAHYNRGVTWYHLREYQKAIDDFDEAIEVKKPAIYAKAYKARWKAKEALGEDADAKEDFATAHYHWGNEAYNDRKYEEAIKNFDKILELNPDFARAYDARGKAKTELGKSKAKLALGESKAELRNLKQAQKLYQEAIENHDKAIELNPERVLSYSSRGFTKSLRAVIRDYNGMIEDYQSAIQDFTEAIDRFANTIKLNPDIKDIKLELANAHYLRGSVWCLLGYAKANRENSKEARKMYNLAREDFKEAIRLEGDNGKHYGGLGLANAALGKARAAIGAFE